MIEFGVFIFDDERIDLRFFMDDRGLDNMKVFGMDYIWFNGYV